MVWGYSGSGLRTTITLDGYWAKILNNFLAVHIGKTFLFPTGAILFFTLLAFIMWVFMRSKTGTALTAVGSNPDFARAGGVSIDRMRVISVVVSTLFAAIGILIYQQSFGFIQLYNAPLNMAFPAVAAILLGGASVNKATILNVVVGTFLFQSILAMTPSVINNVLQTDMSEVIRILISNGMIVYALTRKTKVTK
jgi:simple sugar transport system permease protein